MPPQSEQSNIGWIAYSLMTVAAWGVYGIFLHSGQAEMKDPVLGRYKAFLFVGIAYFLTAVLAPLALLWMKGADWSFTASGSWWSLIAGTAGAIGAFAVLLAFGAGGKPPVVMTIVFAGAPIVNAVVGLINDPPQGGWGSIAWPFYLGIVLAIVGAGLVTMYKPSPRPPAAPAAAQVESAKLFSPAGRTRPDGRGTQRVPGGEGGLP